MFFRQQATLIQSCQQAYQENFKAAVLAAERAVLFTLGFDFMIRLPYNCLLDFVGGYFKEPVEQACIIANIQPGNVHQAAWDVCNERSDFRPMCACLSCSTSTLVPCHCSLSSCMMLAWHLSPPWTIVPVLQGSGLAYNML